ncbi:hypothetical protein ACH5BF_09665 [Arcobacter sp. YIC-464]|uniref:hypothetical protein n=1 Tax=Arcobacter sp. YIC-464 TaxID=3376631 RepID=UPI003C179DF6
MNVYIYGNSGFKKEIHETLEHANIKFKLDADSVIKDINSLDELKNIIQHNPNDIYLIDDEKIIKKDGLTKKLKFLTPKDGIEEEFLLDNGIADLSVDSLKEIPKYIIQKHEQQKTYVTEDIQNSIANIVDDAYSKEENNNIDMQINEEKNEKDDIDFSDSFELDAELASLLERDESSDVEIIEEEPSLELEVEDEFDLNDDNLMSEKELESLMNFEDDMGLNNSSFDYDEESNKQTDDMVDFEKDFDSDENEIDSLINDLENDDIINQLDNELDFEPIEEDIEEDHENLDELLNDESFESFDTSEFDSISLDEPIKGEKMSDEFSELDSLNENDILSAIENLDDIKPFESKSIEKDLSSSSISKNEESIEVNSSSAQDIAQLITKLLNNKTLEITIKIKD